MPPQVGQPLRGDRRTIRAESRVADTAVWHPHCGQVFTSISSAPDHREPVVLMDQENVWEGGALGIIDRNLGPMITDDEDAHRDRFAMPDGSIVVSRSRTALELSNRDVLPDTALCLVTISSDEKDGPHRFQTSIDDATEIADIPGKIETDPKPIYMRRREEVLDPLEHLSNDATSGKVLNLDLAVQLRVPLPS